LVETPLLGGLTKPPVYWWYSFQPENAPDKPVINPLPQINMADLSTKNFGIILDFITEIASNIIDYISKK